MEEPGRLLVRTYISTAQQPIRDAVVIVATTELDGRQKLAAIQLTDPNGIAGPISLPAPDPAESTEPGKGEAAYSKYLLVVEHPGYQLAVFYDLQIFPGVETVQDIALIPLSLNNIDRQESVTVTPQPL